MSLKPGKKSDAGKAWNRKSRTRNIKMQLNYHLIVTEGTKTEPYYFEGLKSALEKNNRKDKLSIKGTGRNTTTLMDEAKNITLRSGYPYQHVWLVYDKDDFPAELFDDVVRRCVEESTDETQYHAIWSNESVELWYLLHFALLESGIHRGIYYTKLNAFLKKINAGEYSKNRTDMFETLFPYLDTAINNADKLDVANAGKPPSNSAPGTQMHIMLKFFRPYL